MPGRSSQGSAGEVFMAFLKLGLTSFGGPIAHLGYFRKELVEHRHWVSESQFGQLLAICQFLPGPASSQLGFALGLVRAGWLGAATAFIAFTLPSALLLMAFATLLPHLSGPTGTAAVHGLKLVACVVVADAVVGMFKTLCPDLKRRIIAAFATGILLLTGSVWLQIAVVAGGAIAGLVLCREALPTDSHAIRVKHGKQTGLILFFIFLLLLVVLAVPNPFRGELLSIANAFYRAGALVFGGGHVVLPLLEESVVKTGWITQPDFLAGYGAAQAIPGPMFTFSVYLGALIPSAHDSWVTATTALIFMFLPGFLLVAAVLPLWQPISRSAKAASAIAGTNAAVVGLLGAALYDPIFTSGIRSIGDLLIVMIAFGLLTIWRLSPLFVVLWCLTTSILLSLL